MLRPGPDRGSIGARVLAVARGLVEDGAVLGTAGNVSARVGAGFVITPTRLPYAELAPEDLVHVLGEQASGPHPPSREWRLHAAVYRGRPDVGGIVHTHSPRATAWSFLGEDLLPELEDNAYYATGPIRTAAPRPAASAELASAAAGALGDSAAVLLGRHGVLAAGPTPEHAALLAGLVERQAEIAWLLRGHAV